MKLLLLVATVAAVLFARPSAAVDVCPDDSACVFTGANYTGDMKEFKAGRYGHINLHGDFNNTVSSVINNRDRLIRLFARKNAKDLRFCLDSTESQPDLSSIDFDDDASHIKLAKLNLVCTD